MQPEGHAADADSGGSCKTVVFPVELDVANAERFAIQLISASASGARVVIADLSNTEYCDSCGVRALMLSHLRASDLQAELRVVTESVAVLRVLEMCAADQVLNIYRSVPEALSAPAPPSPVG
jgi:anti-sigma B factor antagonist